MAKITFCVLPEAGHVWPSLQVASNLKQRGHTIAYLTIPQFRSVVEQTGIQFVELFPKLVADAPYSTDVLPVDDYAHQMYRAIFSRLSKLDTVENDLVNQIAATKPDMIIIDSAACAIWRKEIPCSLAQFHCPIVRMSMSFGDEFAAWPFAVSDFINQLPEMVLCPQELDLPSARPVRHERRFVEPSVFWNRPHISFPWSWIDPDRVLIYSAFGSQNINGTHATILCLLRAMADLNDCQIVVAAGAHAHSLQLGSLPPNVLVQAVVPQLDILTHADVFITHGGLGSIKEAIVTGVPMVVLPFVADQPYNAQRVRYHGLGVSLDAMNISTIQLREVALRMATDDIIRNRIDSLGAHFRRLESESPSIQYLEKVSRC